MIIKAGVKLLLGYALIIITGCSKHPKDFSSVKIGMESHNVLQNAGEPDKRQSIGVADLWTYIAADRTVVLRRDTVYTIVTSATARVDSIKYSMETIGDKVETGAKKAGAAIKNGAGKVVEKIDSLTEKSGIDDN